MKRELDFFTIDGFPGWNQDWFTDWSMYHGGCGAVTACELCIQLARRFGDAALCPCNPSHPTREEFLAFSKVMKPYLSPRCQGIDTLDIYLFGLLWFWRDTGVRTFRAEGLSATRPWEEAREALRKSLDDGIPVPFLLLNHRDPKMKDLQWHWFNLVGYEDLPGDFLVKLVTYGEFHWLSLPALWDTGYGKKGGLILAQRCEDPGPGPEPRWRLRS